MDILLMRQVCGGCGARIQMWFDACPKCGLVLHSARRLRAAGVLYLVLCSFLTVAAIYLLVVITRIVLYPGPSGRFTGGPAGLALTYGALGFVLTLGITGLLMGVWQVVYGRRNMKLVRVVIVLYFIFWIGALLIWFLA